MTRGKQHHDDLTFLLIRAGRGDTRAFEQLHGALFPVVRDYLASLDGSIDYHRRQDLVQDVFFQTWNNLSRFRGEASAKTFVFAIAKNLLLKELSRRQRLRIVHVDELDHLVGTYVSDEPTEAHQGDPDKLSQAVRQAMTKLTEVQRQAIDLDQVCGLPRPEALKLANCTANQFANRLYRAMKSLKQLLKNLPKYILL